jgi:hypothetical protein
VDHRAEAVAWEVANEEATSDPRAMKPTVNDVARNLRMIKTLFVWWKRGRYVAVEYWNLSDMVRRCPALPVESAI